MKYKCPNCRTEYDLIESGNYECVNCHAVFSFTNPVTKAPIPVENSNSICPFCKLEIPQGAKKCGHCGEWISGNPPANPTIYLILSFLFGNWGVAEFYIGNVMLGITYCILNIIFCGIAFSEPGAFVAVAVLWFFQFITALIMDPSSQSEKPKKRKATKWDIIYNIIIWMLGLAIVGGTVGYILLNEI